MGLVYDNILKSRFGEMSLPERVAIGAIVGNYYTFGGAFANSKVSFQGVDLKSLNKERLNELLRGTGIEVSELSVSENLYGSIDECEISFGVALFKWCQQNMFFYDDSEKYLVDRMKFHALYNRLCNYCNEYPSVINHKINAKCARMAYFVCRTGVDKTLFRSTSEEAEVYNSLKMNIDTWVGHFDNTYINYLFKCWSDDWHEKMTYMESGNGVTFCVSLEDKKLISESKDLLSELLKWSKDIQKSNPCRLNNPVVVKIKDGKIVDYAVK